MFPTVRFPRSFRPINFLSGFGCEKTHASLNLSKRRGKLSMSLYTFVVLIKSIWVLRELLLADFQHCVQDDICTVLYRIILLLQPPNSSIFHGLHREISLAKMQIIIFCTVHVMDQRYYYQILWLNVEYNFIPPVPVPSACIVLLFFWIMIVECKWGWNFSSHLELISWNIWFLLTIFNCHLHYGNTEAFW